RNGRGSSFPVNGKSRKCSTTAGGAVFSKRSLGSGHPQTRVSERGKLKKCPEPLHWVQCLSSLNSQIIACRRCDSESFPPWGDGRRWTFALFLPACRIHVTG